MPKYRETLLPVFHLFKQQQLEGFSKKTKLVLFLASVLVQKCFFAQGFDFNFPCQIFSQSEPAKFEPVSGLPFHVKLSRGSKRCLGIKSCQGSKKTSRGPKKTAGLGGQKVKNQNGAPFGNLPNGQFAKEIDFGGIRCSTPTHRPTALS